MVFIKRGTDMNDTAQPKMPDRRILFAHAEQEYDALISELADSRNSISRLHLECAELRNERDLLTKQVNIIQTAFETTVEKLGREYDKRINTYESRVAQLTVDRDQAVADRAYLESVVDVITGALEKAKLPKPAAKALPAPPKDRSYIMGGTPATEEDKS